MDKWTLKKDPADGKTYLTREEDGTSFANPYSFYGRVKRRSERTIAILEKRKKTASLELSFLRWWGAKPLLPEALDGKKVKITIEVLL